MGRSASALGRSVWIMWSYEKRLQFPVNIKEPNAKLAQVIISQFGGPDGELAASMRYLSQRYSMKDRKVAEELVGEAESIQVLAQQAEKEILAIVERKIN